MYFCLFCLELDVLLPYSHQFHKFLSNYFLQRLPFFHTPIKRKLDLSSLSFSHVFSSLYLTVHIMGHFLASIVQLLTLSSAVSSLLFNLSTQFLISMVTLSVFQFDSFSTLPVRCSCWKVKNANSPILSPNVLNVFKDFSFSDLWSARCHLFYQLTLVMVFLPSLCFPVVDHSAGELFSWGVLWDGFAFVSAEVLMNSMGPNKFVGFFLDWGSHNGLVKIWV